MTPFRQPDHAFQALLESFITKRQAFHQDFLALLILLAKDKGYALFL
jgi:hypothetical protein